MSKIDERVYTLKNYDQNPPSGENGNFTSEVLLPQMYWRRLKKITAVWMLAWVFPAILFHIPVVMTSKIKVFNGIPLHWFNASFLSIIVGVILIFLYAFVMDKTDKIMKGG